MGCQCSKLNKLEIVESELISCYEAACGVMPELKIFDCRRPKKSALNNQNTISLVAEFLKTALSNIRLLDSIKLALSKARDMQEIILQSLQCYEEERHTGLKSYRRTLSKLKEFKEAEGRYPALLSIEFSSVCEHQQSIVKELSFKKKEIRDKLWSTKKWKKAWKVLHNVAFMSVLVVSVILAATAAPPLATVTVAAGCTAIKTAEQWFDSIWADRIASLEGEEGVVLAMMKGGLWARELESVRAMVKRLEMRIGSIKGDAGFAVDGEEEEMAVEMAVEEIKGKLGGIGEWISMVEAKAEGCEGEIGKAIAQVLECCYN